MGWKGVRDGDECRGMASPVVWRPATQAEGGSFVPYPLERLLCGRGLPTIAGRLCINYLQQRPVWSAL